MEIRTLWSGCQRGRPCVRSDCLLLLFLAWRFESDGGEHELGVLSVGRRNVALRRLVPHSGAQVLSWACPGARRSRMKLIDDNRRVSLSKRTVRRTMQDGYTAATPEPI